MAVSVIPSAYSQGNGLIDLLNSLRESSEEISDEIGAGAAGSITATAQATLGKSSNMLSGNFASAASSESEYVAATKTAFKAFTQTANQQKSRLTNLLDSLVADYSPNVYERAGSKRGGMTAAGAYLLLKRQIREPEEMEASERNLEEIKENIEHKAAEAMAL